MTDVTSPLTPTQASTPGKSGNRKVSSWYSNLKRAARHQRVGSMSGLRHVQAVELPFGSLQARDIHFREREEMVCVRCEDSRSAVSPGPHADADGAERNGVGHGVRCRQPDPLRSRQKVSPKRSADLCRCIPFLPRTFANGTARRRTRRTRTLSFRLSGRAAVFLFPLPSLLQTICGRPQ